MARCSHRRSGRETNYVVPQPIFSEEYFHNHEVAPLFFGELARRSTLFLSAQACHGSGHPADCGKHYHVRRQRSANLAASAADGSVNVIAPGGCTWTAASNAAWLTVGATSGAANVPVSFHADANTATSARTGTLTISGQTFTVTQAAAIVTVPPVPAGLRFMPVTPCRIADTRNDTGSFGGPVLGAQATRDFPIPQSTCGIPADAQAYSLNFTVVPTNKLNYITVFPTGQTQPLASTLNSFDGRTKANAAIVPAGANGFISVFATDSTQLIRGYQRLLRSGIERFRPGLLSDGALPDR